MRTIVDLASVPPLTCRATLFSSRVTAGEVCERLAGVGARLDFDDDDRVIVELVEPLEVLGVARELTQWHRAFELRAFASAASATEMLREDAEPTRSTWWWMQEALALELPDEISTFVAGAGAGFLDLEAKLDEFLEWPILVLRNSRELLVLDDDRYGRDVAYERDRYGWLLYDRRSGRSTELRVNGSCFESPYRLATGDQVTSVAYGRTYLTHDIVAIL